MLPGLGGLNPKKMQAMMKQMGIHQEDIEASRVIIERPEGNLVISDPQVAKVTMQGQVTWQIVGEAVEEGVSSGDIEMIMEQTGVDEDSARSALDESGGDLAEAIMKLKG